MEFPIIRGRFQLKETEYMEALHHMTDVEAQLCLNQLSYIFFGQAILDKRWQDFDDVSFDQYLEFRKENMFISDSHKSFRRETNPVYPFDGVLSLRKLKKEGSLYVAKLDFDLNDQACLGELTLVLRK